MVSMDAVSCECLDPFAQGGIELHAAQICRQLSCQQACGYRLMKPAAGSRLLIENDGKFQRPVKRSGRHVFLAV